MSLKKKICFWKREQKKSAFGKENKKKSALFLKREKGEKKDTKDTNPLVF